jgi:hypothetical protein
MEVEKREKRKKERIDMFLIGLVVRKRRERVKTGKKRFVFARQSDSYMRREKK